MMLSYQYFFLKRIESIGKILFGCVLLILLCTQEVLNAQTHFSFEFEGRQREYVVYLPQEFQPNLPVVFGFHGYRQGSGFISYTKLHEVADTAGFITIYPRSNPYWNTGLLYPGYPTIDTTVNDVGFISALIDTLYAHYAIDMRRIYSCGFSHGGGMTNVLSGELSNRFAAVASVAGLFNDNSAVRYDPVRPFPILHIHGTEDIIETWDGSKANLWSVDSTINYKLEKNGCSLPGDTVLLPDLDKTDGCTVEKISYTNCMGEGQLIFYKIQGGGHSWPSSATSFGNEGNKNKDINANVEIINFFKKFENPLVYIPDIAFLNALIEEGVDINGDSLISYTEAAETITLWIGGKEISDLSGIEAFVNLDTLICGSNPLTGLDLSKNLNLRHLGCSSSGLSELDVSNNSMLSLLDCSDNELAMLDVSNNPNLIALECSINKLASLDISHNPILEYLYCGSNLLTSLDLSQNLLLKLLSCGQAGNYMVDYPLPPSNTIEVLDISNNIFLEVLLIIEMSTVTEICVWDGFHTESIEIDTTGSPYVCFQTDCNGDCTTSVEESYKSAISIFPNPTDDLLTIETEIFDLSYIQITSLNGQLLYNKEMEGTSYQIDLSSFQKGIYFITIRSKDFVNTKKIIKL